MITNEEMAQAHDDLLEAVRLIYVAKGMPEAVADMAMIQIREKVRLALDVLESDLGDTSR